MTSADSLFFIEPKYCIDTNVIVSFMHIDDEEQYGRDTFPQQWDFIERLISEGAIVSPRRVERELRHWEKEIPEMKAWLDARHHMFRDVTTEQLSLAKQVTNAYPDYGSSHNYIADLEVITLAGVLRLAVITNERARPQASLRMPRIPEVCGAFSIECLSVPGFLRRAKWPE